ncbi:hypothetical protein ISN45_Aa06g027960 [Arabidopsis thaliana x Arabidopsis arenosa]|uniref:Transmembrane protein n=1 Tax=Arabidopsis thaliana x Arabidopsis arenosa TaxID=1240361 RepID=A0A8T1Z083_9BRAS|nr:hypothetical protein ISN45_Aa06g027960 [Arabidopsis thaliana x Arabidopsis arenosa]
MVYVVFVAASYQAWWLLSLLSRSISCRLSSSFFSRRSGFLRTLCEVVFIVIGGTAVRLVGSSLSPTEWLVVKLFLSFVW